MRDTKELGAYLRKCRKEVGLSQIALAKKFGYKVSQNISNVERGAVLPPMKRLGYWCEIVNAEKKLVAKFLLDLSKKEIREALLGVRNDNSK